MQKKLHSRRLDYDAKLAKVQKAKKEKPEWEEEMQAAKAKYEETRECVLGIMSAISESQVRQEGNRKMQLKKKTPPIVIANHFVRLFDAWQANQSTNGERTGI